MLEISCMDSKLKIYNWWDTYEFYTTLTISTFPDNMSSGMIEDEVQPIVAPHHSSWVQILLRFRTTSWHTFWGWQYISNLTKVLLPVAKLFFTHSSVPVLPWVENSVVGNIGWMNDNDRWQDDKMIWWVSHWKDLRVILNVWLKMDDDWIFEFWCMNQCWVDNHQVAESLSNQRIDQNIKSKIFEWTNEEK